MLAALQDADEVVLQAWPPRCVRDAAVAPSPAVMRGAASTTRTRPVAITGLAASGPPDGLTSTSVAEAERLAQDRSPAG